MVSEQAPYDRCCAARYRIRLQQGTLRQGTLAEEPFHEQGVISVFAPGMRAQS